MVKKFDAIPTSYLFIGNSLTGNNDGVHTHFEALMTEAGHDIAIAGDKPRRMMLHVFMQQGWQASGLSQTAPSRAIARRAAVAAAAACRARPG